MGKTKALSLSDDHSLQEETPVKREKKSKSKKSKSKANPSEVESSSNPVHEETPMAVDEQESSEPPKKKKLKKRSLEPSTAAVEEEPKKKKKKTREERVEDPEDQHVEDNKMGETPDLGAGVVEAEKTSSSKPKKSKSKDKSSKKAKSSSSAEQPQDDAEAEPAADSSKPIVDEEASATSSPRKTKKDKKEKRKKPKEPKAASSLEEKDTSSPSIPSEEVPKKQKKKKKSRKNDAGFPDPQVDESLSAQSRKALEYIFTQFTSPSEWKFNKARQNWIIRNVWSTESIPDTYFPLVIKYLADIKGGSREKLKQLCTSILETPPPPTPAVPDTAAAAPVDATDKKLKSILKTSKDANASDAADKPQAGALIEVIPSKEPVADRRERAQAILDVFNAENSS